MAIAREDDEGVELAELSLNDEVQGDDEEDDDGEDGGREDQDGQPGEGGDRAPLLATDGDVRAERRARRARKREAESITLRRRLRLLWKTLCGLLCLGTAVSAVVTVIAATELRRQLGRSFFALPLTGHLLLDALLALTVLLAARGDGEGEPPPPVPTSQVEFQRQLRAGRTIAQARRRPEDDDETCAGVCCGCCLRLGLSRGTAAALALAYAVIDAAWCGFFAVGVMATAWATTVEADGTVAPEWRGMHAALTTAAVLSMVAAGIRILASMSLAAYLRARSRLVYVLRRTSDPPWHYTMSPLMQRVAIRQAGLLVAGSSVLVAICAASYFFHWAVNTDSAEHYDHCDPLDTTLCALPFPSSFFLDEVALSSSRSLPNGGGAEGAVNGGTRTGFRVSFGPKSLPYTRGRKNVSPVALNTHDGFSTLAPILFYLEGLSGSGFAGPGDIGASLYPNSTTWLIDAGTGQMVPHFVELDAMNPQSRLAVLQPAAPLRHATRYIVAVCGALGDWGELLPPTPGFQELVEAAQADRMTKVHPDLRRRANRFSAEVFPAIRKIGRGSGSGSGNSGDTGDAASSPSLPSEGAGGDGGRAGRGQGPEGRDRRERRRLQNGSNGKEDNPSVVGEAGGVAGEGWGAGEGLVGAGLGDVQLAWDFVTASEESQLGVLRAMRETSKAWLNAALSLESASVPPQRKLRDRGARGDESGVSRGVARDNGGHGSDSDSSGNSAAAAVASSNSAAKALESGVTPPNQHSPDLLLGDGRVRVVRKDHNGIDGGGSSSTFSRGKVSLRDKESKRARGSSNEGEGDGREHRRRRASSDAAGASSSSTTPLFRIVNVERFGDYESESVNGSGDAASNDGRGFNAEHPAIVRAVWGRVRVPAFVSPFARGDGLVGGWQTGATTSEAGGEEPGAEGATGTAAPTTGAGAAVRQQQTTTLEAGFVVRVPRCVALGKRRPSAVVQYGHGLFGDRSEVEDGFLDLLAERGAWVLVAADWRGMSRIDLTTVARALVSRPDLLLAGTPDDLMQGFINQEAVLTLVSRRLGDFLGTRAIELSEEEREAIPLSFYGISQGAILGAGYTEFSSLIRRSVLGSGGTPFSLLMPRSVDFSMYHDLLKLNVPGSRDARLLLSLLQMSWDPLEAAAWLAPNADADGPTTAGRKDSGDDRKKNKSVLMQAGTGDAEVSVIGTEILARAYRATAVSPVAVPAWGIPPATAAETSATSSCGEKKSGTSAPSDPPSTASLALYDYRREAAEVPDNDTPPPWGWVHMCVRHDSAAQQQVLEFFETGCVVNFCDGPCERPYCRA